MGSAGVIADRDPATPAACRNTWNRAQSAVNWFTLPARHCLTSYQPPSSPLTSTCVNHRRAPVNLGCRYASRAVAPPQSNTKHGFRHHRPRSHEAARTTPRRSAQVRAHQHARESVLHRRARPKHPRDQVDPLRTHVRPCLVRFVRGASENARKVQITPRSGK